jgi:two-component system sensor histidine kinase DesK
VRLETDIAQRKLPPAQEACSAWRLREAVTNIVRHAGARNCRLTVGCMTRPARCRSPTRPRRQRPFGSGLSGMRERVDVLGGSLTRIGTSGTTITVSLPLGSNAMQERSA